MNSAVTIDTSAWWKVIVCPWTSGHPTRMDSVNWVILTIFSIPKILKHRKDPFTGLPRWNNIYHANRWIEIEEKDYRRIDAMWPDILTKFSSRCFGETALSAILNLAEPFIWTFIFVNNVKRAESCQWKNIYLFIWFNEPSYNESLRSTAWVKPRFRLDLV